MKREQAKKRREKIASAVRKQRSVDRVAEEFGVSRALVRKACSEFGVDVPAAKKVVSKVSREQLLADLRCGKSPKDVSRHYQVSEAEIARLQAAVVQGRAATPGRTSK